MKRRIPGLNDEVFPLESVPEGFYLVRVVAVSYVWHQQKPFFKLRFAVIEPQHLADKIIAGRLYCTPRALWKFNWFLRSFGYDLELISQDQVDEKQLVGLLGAIKVSPFNVSGRTALNLDEFAPADHWKELSSLSTRAT